MAFEPKISCEVSFIDEAEVVTQEKISSIKLNREAFQRRKLDMPLNKAKCNVIKCRTTQVIFLKGFFGLAVLLN